MPVRTAKTFGPCTLNNYDEGDIEWLRNLECNVMTCSKEIGDGGTPHLQFSVTFKRSYSLAALKKLHGRVHWEFQDCVQDNNYCRKRDSELIIDRDERKKKGARTDISEVKEVVASTHSMRAVMDVATSVQSVRLAELWLKYKEPPRKIEPDSIKIHVRWGRTGLGKTGEIWRKHGEEAVFKPLNFKWWEGYDGHEVVILDEFRGDYCKFKELLDLTDIYPYRVECKNGSRQLKAKTFYITSSLPPEEWYMNYVFGKNERFDQLTRRFTSVTNIGVEVDPLLEARLKQEFIASMSVDG